MRIRTIKPEFFHHEALFEAERESGLPLRLAFAGLWCAADREGRFKWEPRRLGVQILPYDGVDFSRVLDALTTRAFVVPYRVDDVCYGVIPSFKRHQVINNRESASILPDPPSETAKTKEKARVPDASPTRDPRDSHASSEEGKGREGKGKERKEDSAPEARVKFIPPTRDELDLAAAKLGLPATQVDAFVGYYGGNGWRVGRNPMKSWQHTLSGWAARWREQTNGHPNSSSGGYGRPSRADIRRSLVSGADDVERQAAESARRNAELAESDVLPFGDAQPAVPAKGDRHG